MIPKKIHFFWEGEQPLEVKHNIDKCKQLHPDWEIKVWNTKSLNIQDSLFYKQCVENKVWGFAVDYIKPYLLYNHGGIWLDADVECLKPLDDLLDNKCFFGYEHEDYNPKFLGTAIIGAEKGNETIKHILDYYTTKSFIDDDGKITCAPSNYEYDKLLKGHDIKIYEQKYLYPSAVTDEAYTIHRSRASWVGFYEIHKERVITACICFRNEGNEVENTIKSILSTTSHTKIMLVDDCSDDSTDYLNVANKYNCEYYKMNERCGSVGTKDFAGRNCQTEYFVLLDGHMRFYEQDWDLKLIKLLDKYPRSIISSRTVYMGLKDGQVVGDKEYIMRSYCAYMRFNDGYDFDPRWTDKTVNYNDEDKTSDVSCILGACYATTKAWWKEIDGLHGLNTYGLEESFMSIKTWLLGGVCKVTHDFGAGHLYRDVNPNRINSSEIDSNRLLLAYLFNLNTAQLSAQLYKRLGLFIYGEALETFANRLEEYKKIKEYLTSKQVRSFDFILDLNKKLIQ